MALGTAIWTDQARAQFLGQDFLSGNNRGATAFGNFSTAVGANARASGNDPGMYGYSTAVGCASAASTTGSTALGYSSTGSGGFSTALGNLSLASGDGSIALGYGPQATGNLSTAVGTDSFASGIYSTALGSGANSGFNRSVAIGYYSRATRDYQMTLGDLYSTYTVSGITTAESLAAQSGAGQFVTSDASGNLALTNTTTGRVGFGTFTPDANSRLDIRSSTLTNGLLAARSDAGPHFLRVETSAGIFRSGVQGNGDAQFGALTTGKGLNFLAGGTTKLLVNSTGQISFGSAPPAITTHALVHQSGAFLTSGGAWTNASSRALKQDIEPITSEEARDTMRALQPVGYRYKNELDEWYVGFIAEDVPELVATNDRKGLAPMDITAVLTKVVQDQDRELNQQRKLLAQQQEMLVSLNKRLTDLEHPTKE